MCHGVGITSANKIMIITVNTAQITTWRCKQSKHENAQELSIVSCVNIVWLLTQVLKVLPSWSMDN